MVLSAFTLFHVVLSLIGIGSGFALVFGLLSARNSDNLTALFLASTLATSLTGFLFPVHRFLPSHAIGILSVIVLAFAIAARYRFHLTGGWRLVFAINATIALYFNVFVLVVQLFKHVPALHALAPTQSEPPFLAAESVVLICFVALGILAAKRFRIEPVPSA